MALTGLLLGALLGLVLQRGRFCVTGAFRDLWVARNTRWFTAFMIVVAVQSIGVFALQALGVITLAAKPLPLIATIVGGLIFGVAIVLAGGCATGTYYRAGEGLVGSWIALAMYALFSAVMKYGPLKPVNDGLRALTVPQTTLYDTLGVSPWILVLVLTALVGWATARHLTRAASTRMATLPPRRSGLAHMLFEKPWHAFATAVVVGLIAIAAWPLSFAAGRKDGLGITTPSANLTRWLVTGNPASIDWGVWLVVGILVGSFVAAKASGEFRVRVPDARQATRSVVGGALMGVGASLAGGCTIGNAMVQTAQFTYQGWIALAAMVLGVGVGAKFFVGTHRRDGALSGASGVDASADAAGEAPARPLRLTPTP
ncbi:YeeE/YedE family protein [Arsenicicoccus sp. oral taxon 190]|uniref:YeeE/YedE family protein n=1 Tax=Arsenicicoccus sp. oral taxon 190 TaxID=1658671 RepID=UPI00067A27BB|nr:YeeE/YedE family protein [Arsenicicoccus sp. oral taxon 190]AKT51707.1 sulfur transporter [Arsenicicoccus sp. oral taxon 190]